MSTEAKCDYCESIIDECPKFHLKVKRVIGYEIMSVYLDFCCENHLIEFFKEKRWNGSQYV
jgi:hypothetical protein